MQNKIIIVSVLMTCTIFLSGMNKALDLPVIEQHKQLASHQAKQNHHACMTTYINQWITELAKQEDFSHFANASFEISAVGPGTPSWIAWLTNHHNETIGYIIIHATEDGKFILGEYGKGEFTQLNSDEFTFLYYDPLHAIYSNSASANSDNFEAYYIEPFQLEEYPLHDSSLQAQLHPEVTTYQLAESDAVITASQSTNYFSPYERLPWLSSKPLNKQFEEDVNIETFIEFDEHIFVTAHIWNEAVFASFSVTAFHEWDENILYLGLQQEDSSIIRYIPFEFLLDNALFYYSS